MRLTLDAVAHHLHQERLLSGRDIVQKRVRIHEVSRRNVAYKVVVDNAGGLFVKQAGNADQRKMVGVEAAWLAFVARTHELRTLRWFCPRFVKFEAESATLVTDLVHPATSLTKFHLNAGSIRFPRQAAETVADVLATLHEAHRLAPRRALLRRFPPQVPRTLPLDSNFGAGAKDVSRASAQILQRIQAVPSFLALLDTAAKEWAPETLVHGDPRWDNFLVTAGRPPRGDLNVRLIDWESLGAGDPGWDVAFHLAEHVRIWGGPIQIRNIEGGKRDYAVPFAMDQFRDAAATFWRAYVRRRRLGDAEAEALWARVSGRFVPAVLLQVALEFTQGFDTMPPRSEVVLEMALRAAAEPEAFCAEAFGIKGGA